jgi:hypothetical protein
MINEAEKLKELSNFKTKEDVKEFEFILSNIIKDQNPEYIPILLSLLDDNSNFSGVMFSIIQTVESYTADVYTLYLLKNINIFYKAPDYCNELFCRILNSQQHLQCLKQNIHLADKETMLRLLDNMENDKYCPEEHKPIIKELRELVKG